MHYSKYHKMTLFSLKILDIENGLIYVYYMFKFILSVYLYVCV